MRFYSVVGLSLAAIVTNPCDATPVRHRTAVRARGNLVALFSDADYPASALARGEQGTVVVRLSISPAGRVAGCVVTRSAGPALDAATCTILSQRALFAPAVNNRGQRTSDTYPQKVIWRIRSGVEEGAGLPFAPRSVQVELKAETVERVVVVRDDKLASCHSSFTPPLDDPGGVASQLPCANATRDLWQIITNRPAGLSEPYRAITRREQFIGERSGVALEIENALTARFITRLTIAPSGAPAFCERVAPNGIGIPASITTCLEAGYVFCAVGTASARRTACPDNY